MKRLILIYCTMILICPGMIGQNVGIGTNVPHPSSELEIKSDTSGLLMPRIDSPSVRINSPAAGLMVYNSSTNTPNYYNGNAWMSMGCELLQNFSRTRYFGGSNTVQNWVVPQGVTKIWIEGWSSGSSGENFTNPNGEIFQAKGGMSGAYINAIIPVDSSSTLNLTIPRANGSELVISRNGMFTIWMTTYEFVLFDTSVLLNQFVPGQNGATASFSFEQVGTNDFRKIIHCGDGGSSYLGGSGGHGSVISVGLPSGSVIGYTGSSLFLNGRNPGGGGGAGYPSGGPGGDGFLIIRY